MPCNHGRLDVFPIDVAPVTEIRVIAAGGLRYLQETCLDIAHAGQLLPQFDSTPGILQDLNCFDSGNVIEKPAAAGVHQHRMSLKLLQLQYSYAFLRIQLPDPVSR